MHPTTVEEYNDILDKGIYKADLFIKTKPDDEYFILFIMGTINMSTY